MRKSLKVYLAGALVCAASLFAMVACEKDEKSAPGAAGSITGATANVCPVTSVALSVGEIENAASYKWYKNGTAISGATAQTYTAAESGTYTVSGVNSEGEGASSPAHVVAIDPCNPPTAGAITGDTEGCDESEVILTASSFTGADSYKWYKDNEPTTVTASTYAATGSGTYTVAGVNANGEGEQSAAHVVTFSDCTPPEPVTPDAAGTITGATANTCPSETVLLTIGEIPNADFYQWYRGDVAIEGATASTYEVTQSGSYKVAGVNAVELDEGEKSPALYVTITSCIPAKPSTPKGPNNATTNNCDLQQATLNISTGWTARAATLTWYKIEEGGSSSTVQSKSTAEEGYLIYEVAASGTYAVRGISNVGVEGPLSDPVVVTITECEAFTAVPQGTPVILANNVDDVHARDCDANKSVWLNLDNLKSPPVASSSPITGALSYTWYIYREAAPNTPVELETDVLTGSGDYSNIQLVVTEAGSYTIKASNGIGDGTESEKYAISWIACPPAARTITKGTCDGNAVIISITHGPIEWATGNYYWYKDGIKIDETTGSWDYNVTEAGTYKMKVHDATEGDSDFSNEIVVTGDECEGGAVENVAYTDFPGFTSPATFDVYDNIGTNMANTVATQYTVTVNTPMVGGGNPVVITGLGGTGYESGQLTLYFDATGQTLIASNTGKEDTPLSYGSNKWYNGAAMINGQPIKATVKKVGGKIYIYIQSSSMPVFAYAIWSDEGGSAASVLLGAGVDASAHEGEGYATVLVQQ